MQRTLGECRGKPTHPTVGAQEFGCTEYHLDRNRLLPGVPVPDDADLSPNDKRARDRQQLQRNPPPRQPTSQSRSRSIDHDQRRAPEKLQNIPLEDGEDSMDRDTLKRILADVLDDALGQSDTPMHPRYAGGKLIVQPANLELQAKEMEAEVLFKKVVGIRDKLRLLEQKVNASELITADKVQIQQYITSCYGSLTSFNYLFKDKEDFFVGQSGS